MHTKGTPIAVETTADTYTGMLACDLPDLDGEIPFVDDVTGEVIHAHGWMLVGNANESGILLSD